MGIVYEYRVRDQGGKNIKGKIEAESKLLVISKLREQGYIVTSVHEKPQGTDVKDLFSTWFGTSMENLVIFSRQFATMMSAGLPIIRSLDILARQTSDNLLAKALVEIKRDVEAGITLSAAMAKYPKAFPELFVTLIHAGEVGGILDITLERLAEYYEKEHEIWEKVKTAARYPAVILAFALLVVVVMLLTVVPTFSEMFKNMNAELPLATRILLGLNHLLTTYYPVILLVLAGVGFAGYRFFGQQEGKLFLDKLISKSPVFGDLTLKMNVARITRTLGTLLSSGVPILQALDVVASISGRQSIKDGLIKAKENVREGEGIAAPLEEIGIFPPMVTQMIAVGEETGNIDGMLNKVADFYEKEVKNTTERLTSLIEPFLIAFLAIVVGGIIMATIMPVFDLYQNMGQQ